MQRRHYAMRFRPLLPRVVLGAVTALTVSIALAACAPLRPAAEAAAPARQHFPADDDLQLMLRYLVEDGEAPGVVMGMLEPDGTQRILWYGDAGPGALPLGPRSVFEMASITKVFTGILLADMVDRGEVALDDPVAKYLPDRVTVPSRNGREITLLDLATHRSALTRMPDNMPQGGGTYPPYDIEDMYAFLSSHTLRRDIGSEFEYSNIGVALLGHALERAAGQDYETLLRERILDPLGMTTSSTRVEGEVRRWMTRGHGANLSPAPYRNWPHLPAMGALRSNAEDMLRFLKANRGEPESRLERVMRVAQEPRAVVSDEARIGLNWQIRTVGDRRILTHSGGTAGYNTRIALDPDRGVGVVLLTNSSEFGDDIDLDFLRRGPPLAIPEVDVNQERLEEYVGSYRPEQGDPMVVRLEPEGWLTLQAPGQVRFRMYAESDTSFFVKRAPWRFAFHRNAAGEVAGVVADLEGVERRATREEGPLPSPAAVARNPALILPLTREEMAPYVGSYAIQVGAGTRPLRVFVDGHRLYAEPAGQDAARMLYQGRHEFVLAAPGDVRLEFAVDDGQARSVTVQQYGGVFHGTREP